MFGKVRTVVEDIRNHVLMVKQEVTNRISETRERVDSFLFIIFPPEYRRLVYSASWITGKFIYEFFSILWGAAKWFGNLLLRIATFWQVVFWNSKYREIFATGGFLSVLMAIGGAPEFLIILFFLIIIPFFFACLCAIAARAVPEFIYLFFKFMPPVVWVPVVALPLAFVAFRAYIRTELAWRERKELMFKDNPADRSSVTYH